MSLESESEKFLKENVSNPEKVTASRYDWKSLPLPKFWWLTFWKNYGEFFHVKRGSKEFKNARYEVALIFHRDKINL